jgi:hypothetical protein
MYIDWCQRCIGTIGRYLKEYNGNVRIGFTYIHMYMGAYVSPILVFGKFFFYLNTLYLKQFLTLPSYTPAGLDFTTLSSNFLGGDDTTRPRRHPLLLYLKQNCN